MKYGKKKMGGYSKKGMPKPKRNRSKRKVGDETSRPMTDNGGGVEGSNYGAGTVYSSKPMFDYGG